MTRPDVYNHKSFGTQVIAKTVRNSIEAMGCITIGLDDFESSSSGHRDQHEYQALNFGSRMGEQAFKFFDHTWVQRTPRTSEETSLIHTTCHDSSLVSMKPVIDACNSAS
ncbi:hypothetical protein BDR03DRAFT_1003041 [Suillus americanus]|nr:hypothetical protein BDR03DRAFT_1003041 [Suillus americanus]